LTTEEGLPANHIYKIMKDSHGMIWITTSSGLCRYDGYDFKIYQYNPSNSNSITHNNIHGPFMEDADGNLWIGTNLHGGLNKYDALTDSFTSFKIDDHSSLGVSEILWVVHCGVTILDPMSRDDQNYTFIRSDSDDPETLSGSDYRNIYKAESGIIWISSEQGVNILDEPRSQIEQNNDLLDRYETYPRILLEDSRGNYWIGTKSEDILKFDREMNLLNRYIALNILKDGTNNMGSIRSIIEDLDHNIWAGSTRGLYFLDKHKSEFVKCSLPASETGSKRPPYSVHVIFCIEQKISS